MYYHFILPAVILYPLLTYKTTREVWKRTNSKRITIITLAIFLLIPTWDVVIGYGIFLYKWATWSGTKIYKTVEAEGMYFEGKFSKISDNGIVSADVYFRKGYLILEALIDTDWREYREKRFESILYRCTYDSDRSRYYKYNFQRVKCLPTESPISKFKVVSTKSSCWITEDYTKTVSSIATGEVLGCARSVSIKYLVIAWVPFFNWLGWHDRLYFEMASNNRAYSLEYEIIKPLINAK